MTAEEIANLESQIKNRLAQEHNWQEQEQLWIDQKWHMRMQGYLWLTVAFATLVTGVTAIVKVL